MTAPSITSGLAEFVAETAIDQIDPAVRGAACAAVTHVISAARVGALSPPQQNALASMEPAGASGGSHVIGTTTTGSPSVVAFANAVAAYVGGVHDADAVIVAVALSCAEGESAPLDQLERAVVIGREVAARVALGLGDAHRARGYELLGTAGRLGATAAAAALLHLSADLVRASLGFASTTAAGLDNGDGAELTAFVAGLAASDVVEAAQFARAGLTGPPEPIEGRRGLFSLESPAPEPERVLDGLATSWLSDLGESTEDWSAYTIAELIDGA